MVLARLWSLSSRKESDPRRGAECPLPPLKGEVPPQGAEGFSRKSARFRARPLSQPPCGGCQPCPPLRQPLLASLRSQQALRCVEIRSLLPPQAALRSFPLSGEPRGRRPGAAGAKGGQVKPLSLRLTAQPAPLSGEPRGRCPGAKAAQGRRKGGAGGAAPQPAPAGAGEFRGGDAPSDFAPGGAKES